MGEFEHTVDEKGRIAIPAKFRSKFADGLVVTRGLDGCLFIYTSAEWAALAERIGRLPLSKPEARYFQRMMFSGASDCQLDQQGRFTIPTYLRDYGAIRGEAVITGVNTRLEVWAKERWRDMRDKVEEDGTSFAEQLVELGI